jgi:hypothetical protein
MTWYDILGVAPGASAETVRRAYEARTEQLRSYGVAGSPLEVTEAAARGEKAINAAWLILGNRGLREQYDEDVGAVRKGEGLAGPEAATTRPEIYLMDSAADALETAADAVYWSDVQQGLSVLAGLLAAMPRPSRRRSRRHDDVVVPDVRGLFFRACQDALTMAGFRISTLRLTGNPMPVEGLVVGQSPAAGQKVPRFSTLTVHVWHPPRTPMPGRNVTP